MTNNVKEQEVKNSKLLISVVMFSFPAISVANVNDIQSGVYYKMTPQIAKAIGLDLTTIKVGPNEQVVFKLNESGEVADLRSIENSIEHVHYLQMADHARNIDGDDVFNP